MKNLILQHWCGKIDKLVDASSENIGRYAKSIGAEHKLVLGHAFHPWLSAPCQKLCMIKEEYDEYDNVVMMDADMFAVPNLEESIFDISGIGRHYGIQSKLRANLVAKFGTHFGSLKAPYWGGSIYKLDRQTRINIRGVLDTPDIERFNKNYEDEGIMHYAAMKLGMSEDKAYLPQDLWNMSSFEIRPEVARIIHIRTKRVQGGAKYTKWDNYELLRKRKIL